MSSVHYFHPPCSSSVRMGNLLPLQVIEVTEAVIEAVGSEVGLSTAEVELAIGSWGLFLPEIIGLVVSLFLGLS